MSDTPVRVGIVGLGRSGWDIHAAAFQMRPELFKVTAVHDVLPQRMRDAAATLECRAHATLPEMLRDPDVELVVVASPNKFHFEHALAALEAGKHVLCEKPFGTSTAEVDRMIAAAAKHGRVLQPFQQRRYETDYLKVKEICDSGILGKLQFIRICWHSFKRRWDWQTTKAMSGGELFNNGPHPIDHAMLLFDGDDGTSPSAVEPSVWCERRRTLCSGDAEDHVKIVITGADRPTVEIEISSVFAYGQDRWLICGTAGGLRGGPDGMEWKWVDWSKMPPRPLDTNSTPDRSYNSEKLTWQTGSWKPQRAADAGSGAPPASQPILDLYKDLYETLRHGKPQVITPQSVRRRVAILERCAASPVRG